MRGACCISSLGAATLGASSLATVRRRLPRCSCSCFRAYRPRFSGRACKLYVVSSHQPMHLRGCEQG